MRADEAQAAIARCLVDPAYLRGDQTDDSAPDVSLPTALRDGLRLFRGFITRIKHTQLRRIVPLSLRLLALHKLDIGFFADYAPGYQQVKRAGPLTTAQSFLRFERELMDRLPLLPAPARDQIEAMLRHETLIWNAIQTTAYANPAPHPRLRAGVAVERFTFDILALATAVTIDRFAAPTHTSGDRFLLYHPVDGHVQITEIDALSAWVLSRLDGLTSIGTLIVALEDAVGTDARSAIDDLLADAAARHLLDPCRRPSEG